MRQVHDELEARGFAVLHGLDEREVYTVLRSFGEVLLSTEVTVKDEREKRPLVTSARALHPHTDHHRAEVIVWYCAEQSELGGETLLVDGRTVFSGLSRAHQDQLRTIELTEHGVFPDDPLARPLVSEEDGVVSFYYAHWLVQGELTPAQAEALEAWRKALEDAPKVRFRLAPGDLLAVDNGWILHGRTAIGGDRKRLLRRYWLRRHRRSAAGLELPAPITPEREAFLVSKGVHPEVASIDLSMVKLKLQAPPKEGQGWTAEQCEEAELEYKRFLTLNLLFPGSIVPHTTMDLTWHQHILDTRAYHRDMQRVFGGYFHHFPYFGMRGTDDAERLLRAFERTKELYEQVFGEPMLRHDGSSCWHDCEGRCWHACSDG